MVLSKMTCPSLGSGKNMSINGYNHHFHRLVSRRRISPSQLFAAIVGPRRSMVMAAAAASSPGTSSDGRRGGAYTTIKEKVVFEREIKKSKFIAMAGPVSDEQSAFSFLSQVRDPRATHNCWAYKVGDQYRSNDDGEPSGTAGKPIYSAIESSGIDRVMVVVIRHFGGIKLGTGGLARAYGGVALECLKNAPTCLVKSKVPMGVEIPYELLGVLYHQLQAFHAEDVKQDYETGNDVTTMVTFKVDYDQMEKLEEAIKANCGRDVPLWVRCSLDHVYRDRGLLLILLENGNQASKVEEFPKGLIDSRGRVVPSDGLVVTESAS